VLNTLAKNRRWLLIAAFFLLSYPFYYAQAVQISARIDTGTIRIGDQTSIHLSVLVSESKPAVKFTWPHFSDSLIKSIYLVRLSKIDTISPDTNKPGSAYQYAQTLVITSFDSGYYAIPPFRFILNGDTTKPQLTDAILLRVQGMRVDTTLAIKDIKQPLQVPFNWKELFPILKWVGLGLFILTALFFLLRHFLRKKPSVPKHREQQIPAHITALKRLQTLQDRKLWQEGKQKEYHSELTDILRVYIEQRFRINAMEQTSDEILASFRSIPIKAENKDQLKQVLLLSDMIKFAKQVALPDENEMSMNNAVAFVQETKMEQTTADTQPKTLI
jgi:hypothetical protein